MRPLLMLAVPIILSACATTYQPQDFSGGFTETQLDTNVFKVSFRGNGHTHAERAEDLALLRSAELTLKNGFTHFVVIDSQSREERGSYTAPSRSHTTANATVYGNSAYGTATTTTYGGETFNISKPSTTNTIMCFKGKPDIQGLVYDAQFLCNSLGSKYNVVCGAHSSSGSLDSIPTAPKVIPSFQTTPAIKPDDAEPQNQTRVPGVVSFSQEDLRLMEDVCTPAKHGGPVSYDQCLVDQISQIASAPVRPNLSNLSSTSRQSIEAVCGMPRTKGPAAYNTCLNSELAKLNSR